MRCVMKNALRLLSLSLIIISISMTAFAESRAKTLKRAAGEMRRANFAEAERLYRLLIEKDSTDNIARLGLSFSLIKQIRLQEAYEQAAQVISTDPLNARAFAVLGTARMR